MSDNVFVDEQRRSFRSERAGIELRAIHDGEAGPILPSLNGFRRPTLALALVVVTVLAALCGLLGVGTAAADTENGQVTRIVLDLGQSPSSPSLAARTRYQQAISELRRGVAHGFRPGVLVNQNYRGGMVRVELQMRTAGGEPGAVIVWINPQDVYVVAYTNQANQTYFLNDTDNGTRDQIRAAVGAGGVFATLNFGGNYNSLRGVAGRDIGNTPISWDSFANAVLGLGATTDPFQRQQQVARDLMVSIQFLSEAARFNAVYNRTSNAMAGQSSNGLPALEESLERHWASISQYGVAISQNPATRPRYIDPVIGTLGNWTAVARYLALILGVFILPEAPVGGSTAHTEL